MIETIFRHIEFLLPKSGCVIVPDLGAFIVNIETSKYDLRGFMSCPNYSIVFNQELKHNDGLLASSIQTKENISYEKANKIIKNAVADIKASLLNKEIFNCGKIGYLCLDKNKNIGFYCNTSIIYPQLWGLNHMYLNKIETLEKSDIQPSINHRRKRKSLLASAVAVAATVFLFVMPSTHNIGVSNVNTVMQQADFINTLTTALNSNHDTTTIIDSEEDTIDNKENILTINDTLIANNEQTNVKSENADITTPISLRTYYIIIGGDTSRKKAEKLLSKHKQAGFENADIVQSNDNYRVYIASFNNKKEAESFLDTFRVENPNYKTAWLFSKKNN